MSESYPVLAIGFPQAEIAGDSRSYDVMAIARRESSFFLGLIRFPDKDGIRLQEMRQRVKQENQAPDLGIEYNEGVEIDMRLRMSGGLDNYQPGIMTGWMNFFNSIIKARNIVARDSWYGFELKGSHNNKKANLIAACATAYPEYGLTLTTHSEPSDHKLGIEVALGTETLEAFKHLEAGFQEELKGKTMGKKKKNSTRALRLDWNKIVPRQLTEEELAVCTCNAAEFDRRTSIFTNMNAVLA